MPAKGSTVQAGVGRLSVWRAHLSRLRWFVVPFRVELWCQSCWCAPLEALSCPEFITSCCSRREMKNDFFDVPPDEMSFNGCLKFVCCGRTGYRRRMRQTAATPAHLHCTVSLVPKENAERQPVGEGRSAPDPLPEPLDRPSPNLLLTDPLRYLTLVTGEQNCALMKVTAACLCGVLIAGIIAFVIAQIVIASRMP